MKKENKRLLFVTYQKVGGGGLAIRNRNIDIYKRILGENNVKVYFIPNHPKNMRMLYYRLRYTCLGDITPDVIREIVAMAKNYDYVHIDDSNFGTLARRLKKVGYVGRIITFYHNINVLFVKRNLTERLLYLVFNRPIKLAESFSAQYSDFVLALTERDKDYILTHYCSKATVKLLPSSLPDEFADINGYTKTPVKCNQRLELLFVGSGNFYPNKNGVMWFLENILPHVNARLTLVGNKMDEVFTMPSEKLRVVGFVEDLGEYYRNADCVVEPIFEGSGMKTKTAEALMWGKYIIGTDEAFVGYEMPSASALCNTAEEFICKINELSSCGVSPYNESSRQMFLRHYSLVQSEDIIRGFLFAE